MSEELIEQENKLYESTKDFGRIQFIREIIKLQQENTQLKEDFKKEQYLVDKLTRQISDEYKNTNFQSKKAKQLKERIQKATDYFLSNQ